MLNGKLQLHDINDTEAFTAQLLHRQHINGELQPCDREDLHAYLIALCWQLSLEYRPGGISFSTWAGDTLRKRLIDWQRDRNGRTRWQFKDGTYERKLPVFVEFDETHHETGVDPAERGDPDGERLDTEGSISPLAYLPPRSYGAGGGVRGPRLDETSGARVKGKAA